MKLSIPDMSCGHCKATVEQAIRTLDKGAEVQVDLGTRTATVVTAIAAEELLAALSGEGYPAEILA